jgi:hypothetical protein
MNMVEKSSYQIMWDNCEKLKEDLKKTDDIVEHNDRIYKKNLAELKQQKQRADLRSYEAYKYKKLAEDNFIQSVDDSETSDTWKDKYEHELKMAESWKDAFYKKDAIKGCNYVFSEIPNDCDGQRFTDDLKKYLNKDSYKLRVRGQYLKDEVKQTEGWRRYEMGQPMDKSKCLRVYVDVK